MGLEPDGGFVQEALQQLTQTVVELEAAQQIGAARYERTPERKTYRNGHRDRMWETGDPVADPEGPRRELLPEPVGAPSPVAASASTVGGKGASGGGAASPRGRREYTPGG